MRRREKVGTSGPGGANSSRCGDDRLSAVFRNQRIHQATSREVLESGVFDAATLERVMADHFSRRADHHHDLVFALDLALARQTFRARA